MLVTKLAKGGSASGQDHADNWIMFNRFRLGLAGTDGAGIEHVASGAGNHHQDIRAISNHMESMQHGIWSADAAGWTCFDNHIYARRHGIYFDNAWFADQIALNYIDSFGVENTAGLTYYGIRLRGHVGRGLTVLGNQAACNPTGITATSLHYCFALSGTGSPNASLVANRALGPDTGSNVGAFGYLLDTATSAQPFYLTERRTAPPGSSPPTSSSCPARAPSCTSTRGVETGAAAWTPGAIGAGGGATQSVSVANAGVGDPVVVGYSQNLQDGLVLTGEVSAFGTVTAQIRNVTRGSLTPTAGTVRATVFKHG